MKKVMWIVGVSLSVVLFLIFGTADYDFTNAGYVVGYIIGMAVKIGIPVGFVLLVIWLIMRKKGK